MTAKTQFPPNTVPSRRRLSVGRCLTGSISLLSLILILTNADVAIASMTRGLHMCAKTVIPSLFPFMVISELIVQGGVGNAFGRLLSRPMRWLFGVSGAGACAVLLGSLCGFPIGAKTAVSLYDRGELSRTELETVLTFSNNPSSAFLISAVGLSLYGSRTVGVMLEGAVLLSSLLIGIAGKRRYLSAPGTSITGELPSFRISFLTNAITSAAQSMLVVCAYVLFFSSLLGCLAHVLEAFSPVPALVALLFSAFELTGGVSLAAGVPNTTLSLAISAFAVGWSGLSVHMQILSLCGGRGISFKPYFIAKLIQGLLCTAILLLLIRLFPSESLRNAHTVMLPFPAVTYPPVAAILTHGGFLFGTLRLIGRRLFR